MFWLSSVSNFRGVNLDVLREVLPQRLARVGRSFWEFPFFRPFTPPAVFVFRCPLPSLVVSVSPAQARSPSKCKLEPSHVTDDRPTRPRVPTGRRTRFCPPSPPPTRPGSSFSRRFRPSSRRATSSSCLASGRTTTAGSRSSGAMTRAAGSSSRMLQSVSLTFLFARLALGAPAVECCEGSWASAQSDEVVWGSLAVGGDGERSSRHRGSNFAFSPSTLHRFPRALLVSARGAASAGEVLAQTPPPPPLTHLF